VSDAKLGDTVTEARGRRGGLSRLPELKPMVFAGLYPVEARVPELRDALEKLR